jgi:hypothetical protein
VPAPVVEALLLSLLRASPAPTARQLGAFARAMAVEGYSLPALLRGLVSAGEDRAVRAVAAAAREAGSKAAAEVGAWMAQVGGWEDVRLEFVG